MALNTIFRPLGVLWILLGLAAFLTALAAVSLGEPALAVPFVGTAAIAIFPAILFLAVTRGMPVRANAVDALGLALLAWVTAPLIAALPLILTGFFKPLDAVFEAYSAVTTTGAVLVAPEDLPRTLVFWRSLLSWLGGYATLVLAAALFSALDRDAPAIRKSVLLTVRPENVFSHLGLAAGRIAMIYGVLTGFVWLALLMSGMTLYAATTLAMSALSTGGYLPFSGGLAPLLGGVQIWIIALGCLAGALNISLFWDVLRDRKAFIDPDLVGFGALLAGVFVLYSLAQPTAFSRHIFDALFVVTTSGFTISGGLSPVPLAALFAAMIGGAAASTAGGIKISRILLLWKRMGAELATLADPASIVPVRFRDRPAPDRALIAIWSYVLAFIATLGLGGIALAIAGMNFDEALTATGAALSNVGPLFTQSGHDFAWETISDASKLILIPVMILGRLEVLAGLSAIWALFFRK